MESSQHLVASIYDCITGAAGSVVVDDSTKRTRDGYLPSLQAQGRSSDPNTLFYLSGDGNDFLQFLTTNPQQAPNSANRLANSVEALQKAGGRYFISAIIAYRPVVTVCLAFPSTHWRG